MINPEFGKILEKQTEEFKTAYSCLEKAVNDGVDKATLDILLDRVHEAQDQLDHTISAVETHLWGWNG